MGLESKTPFILAASMLLVIVFLLIIRTSETVVNDPEENQKILVNEHSGDEADESKTTTDLEFLTASKLLLAGGL